MAKTFIKPSFQAKITFFYYTQIIRKLFNYKSCKNLKKWGQKMGLFSKKRKEEALTTAKTPENLPELPEFPEMHDEELQEDVLEFPSYEPTIKDIKGEVGKEDEEFEVPKRESRLDHRVQSSAPAFSKTSIDDEKPLFVQIDKYKDVLRSLEVLKAKVADVEDLLKGLEELKQKEEEKLQEWKEDVQSIKEKLLSIDQELFEV